MPATLATVQKSVIHLMNANTSGTYNTSVTDDRFTSGLIDEQIFQADEAVYLACAESVGHWARPSMLTLSSDLSNGDAIPAHVGDLGKVVIKRSSGESTYYPAHPVRFSWLVPFMPPLLIRE